MQLRFLGTGAAMPSPGRAQSGVLLSGDGEHLLVDCGSGVLGSLAETTPGYEAVDTVLLTHHHLDHVADLLPLLKARWLAGEESLRVVGPPGTESLVENLLEAHDYLRGRVDLTVSDHDGTVPALSGFDIAARETVHSMQCFAYRLARGDGPSVVLGADSEADDGLIRFADGAAILVHDCSFPDDVDVSNHPTPSQLGAVLDGVDADIGRVYLTHFYPHTEGRHDEMLDSISDHYDGDVAIAEDGLTVSVE
jgi:ribonuclease BN (tRNA processing enzyme)